MTQLDGILEVDARRRRAKADRKAGEQELKARNACIAALAHLPDPLQALAVIQRVEKSVLEYIDHRRRGLC